MIRIQMQIVHSKLNPCEKPGLLAAQANTTRVDHRPTQLVVVNCPLKLDKISMASQRA